MAQNGEPSGSSAETLEITSDSPFPSMLLLKKNPPVKDAAACSAEMARFRQNGSSVLQRIKDFIPEMKESQTALQQKVLACNDPEELDIEHVEEGSTAVEFNLALFEQGDSDTDDSSSDSSDSDSSLGHGSLRTGSTAQTKPKISLCEDEDQASQPVEPPSI
ncbi:hypothetical protein BV898_09562 [Hypsibius exemplaris]|uniref:Uncharacterized protein n=1 Tax=Hypsibius exemplaris TaxID=2072580 RepID=A0A1W0WMA5_HYPEX|nr:hypothetical protein BV898_09562 [Hypsibius exemplaris]